MTSELRRIIALVPLKAHSDRIPGKNFRMLAGRPLFRWIVDTLLAMPEIGQIVINTDATELLRQNGLPEDPRIALRDRKPELRGDFTSMNLILADDIANVPADTYLMTHVTNPLLGEQTIRAALTAYDAAVTAGSADSLFSVTRHQGRFYRPGGSPVNHDPERLVRTQDLEPLYEENSNLYLFSTASFSRTNARIGARPLMFETPALESIDIDDMNGWRLAEWAAAAAVTA